MRWTWVAIAVGLALAARTAEAQPAPSDSAASANRAVIDRIDLEPSSISGQRLRVYLSAMSLQGSILDLDTKSLKTQLDKSELKAPYTVGGYSGTTTTTVIVVVVQATTEFADALPVIADALDQSVLAVLPERTQIAFVPYGSAIGTGKLMSLKTARGKTGVIASDGSGGDPALLDTIERAIGLFKKVKTEPPGRPVRKMILLIGDGRDANADRARVEKLGDRAAREGVRIHSFGYAPTNQRRPLLLLGELSKRSFGTFRWVRGAKADSWGPAMEQMRDQITKQYVLTYFVGPPGSDDDPAGKKLKISASGRVVVTTLNEIKVPAAACNGETCEGYCTDTGCAQVRKATGRGVFGWIVMMLLFAIGGIAVLAISGYVITKRQQKAIVPPPGFPLPPGSAPPVNVPSIKPPSAPPVNVASAPPAVAQPPVQAVVTGPRFYIMSGPRAGQEIGIRHGFSIGKSPGNDLMIDDGYTSGQHAHIGMDHFGNCRVYDRGSTNGTFVNGVRVTEYALEHGNTLRIGSTDLRFLAQ